MIKKAILLFAVLFFAFGILFVSVRSTAAKPSYAVASLKFTVPPAEPTPTLKPKVEYLLAYPGVLPDSPIYKVKMVRDQIWLWLTTSSLKKAELYLLYADKRLGAGKALFEGNQVPLGLSTIVKGEKYLEKAVWETEKLDSAQFKGILAKALLKHEEIITELREKADGQGKTVLDDLLSKLKDLQKKGI